MIRFAILKEIDGAEAVVLEYDEVILRARLENQIHELLYQQKVGLFTSKDKVIELAQAAAGEAWDNIINEFKDKSVTIK